MIVFLFGGTLIWRHFTKEKPHLSPKQLSTTTLPNQKEPKKEPISISVKKQEYIQGVDISFEVTNNSKKDIFYYEIFEVTPNFRLERKIKNNDWKSAYFEACNYFDWEKSYSKSWEEFEKEGSLLAPLKKLAPNQTAKGVIQAPYIGEKREKKFINYYPGPYFEFVPGTYRIAFYYKFNPEEEV